MKASSSRATRSPDSEVSQTSARHQRERSSMIARMRNRRTAPNTSAPGRQGSTARKGLMAPASADVIRSLPANGLGIAAHQPAGLTPGDLVALHQRQGRTAPPPGRRQFFPSRSMSIVLSRTCLARSRFSREFSSSNCLSRRASDTSIPPYFDFQR